MILRCISRAQVFSWVLMLITGPVVTFCLAPLLYPYAMIVHGVIYFVIVLQVIVITIYDPAPAVVRAKRKAGFIPPKHPPKKGHIIVGSFCTICEVEVPANTKHCKRCNKCCETFDHHCVWLNTCVGGKNYRMFLRLIWSLSFYLTVWTFVLIVLIVIGFTNLTSLVAVNKQGEYAPPWLLEWFLLPLVGWILLDVVAFLVLTLFNALIIHLICFHYKLKREGSTTYAFIQKQRRAGSRATTDTVTGGGSDLPASSASNAVAASNASNAVAVVSTTATSSLGGTVRATTTVSASTARPRTPETRQYGAYLEPGSTLPPLMLPAQRRDEIILNPEIDSIDSTPRAPGESPASSPGRDVEVIDETAATVPGPSSHTTPEGTVATVPRERVPRPRTAHGARSIIQVTPRRIRPVSAVEEAVA